MCAGSCSCVCARARGRVRLVRRTEPPGDDLLHDELAVPGRLEALRKALGWESTNPRPEEEVDSPGSYQALKFGM